MLNGITSSQLYKQALDENIDFKNTMNFYFILETHLPTKELKAYEVLKLE